MTIHQNRKLLTRSGLTLTVPVFFVHFVSFVFQSLVTNPLPRSSGWVISELVWLMGG